MIAAIIIVAIIIAVIAIIAATAIIAGIVTIAAVTTGVLTGAITGAIVATAVQAARSWALLPAGCWVMRSSGAMATGPRAPLSARAWARSPGEPLTGTVKSSAICRKHENLPSVLTGWRRSEERRVGKECGRTCRTRGSPNT